MFRMSTYGPWKQAMKMLDGYNGRVEYAQKMIGFELANRLLDEIKDKAPNGNEYSDYLRSLQVVELDGEKGVISFAIISNETMINVSSIKSDSASDRTVVYIQPGVSGNDSGRVSFLSSINPWPINLLPNGLRSGDATLVHRMVSSDEVDSVRLQVVDFIKKNDAELRSLGFSWNIDVSDEENVNNLSSIPDYMWMALRAEFGIQESARPHWRPAIRKTMTLLKDVIKNNKELQRILQDTLYRKHTLSNSLDVDKMSSDEFNKKTGKFQEAVL